MDFSTLLVLTFSFFFMAFACSGNNGDLSDKSIEEVAKMIHEEVGNAVAGSVDQCDMLPIGVKPAGGPWGYLVYSNEVSDQSKLEKLVDRYNKLDAKRNEESDGISTADMATEPALILQNGACRGDGIYAWNPGDLLDFNDINPEGS